MSFGGIPRRDAGTESDDEMRMEMRDRLRRRMGWGVLLAALMLGAAAGPAFAEAPLPTPGTTPAAEETQDEWIKPAHLDDAPKVIDRWNVPEAYPGFSFDPGQELLEIWLPQVQEMDATILRYQGETWMIDCGDELADQRIVPLIKALGITEIRRMFNTHPHHDHLGGLEKITAEIPTEELLVCFPDDLYGRMHRVLEYCAEQGIRVTYYNDEQVFTMGDGLVRILNWQKVPEQETMNDRSAQFMVSYGNCSFLIMADIERAGMRYLFDAVGPEALKADILRYPHHGKEQMWDDVYQAIDPELVVFTASRRFSASSKFMQRYPQPTVYTAQGILHMVTDGERWLCEKADKAALFGAEALETEEPEPKETP